MLSDTFSLSIKNLRHRGLRSWLTLLGIFIGVLAVVSLISLGSGLQTAVSSQFGISSTELLSVQAGGISNFGPPGSGAVDPLTSKELEAIEKLSSVKRAVGRDIVSAKLEYNKRAIFGYATNIPSGENRKFIYEQIEAETVVGRLLKDDDVGKVVLGYNFYTDSVGLGKKVVPGNTVAIQDKSFQVVGILEKKGSFIFDNVAYMNEEDLDSISNYGDKIDIIAVQPVNKDEILKTKEDIEKVLRKVRDVKVGDENFEVSTPESSLESVNAILGGVQMFIVIVASISIFIGALGIVNTMTTSVLERKKEIGIMKSIGATNSQIFTQFFIESSLLGLVGGFVGALFGTLIGLVGVIGINSFVNSDLAPSINFVLIFFSLIGSFLIGGIAGIAPAVRAAKQNPVEALRD
ncbi:MAG: ABC transporter permease [Nanoarchaeota archaeon]|nr:ABC transporter permease [Nanoarchaeota archaeon]